ncbi:acyl-CoA thioesterase [Planococcus sp. ANT_H30]|uniref:Thioesterase n=2 Tax=Planococcus TaxID=1372 RepID=A0ABM5WXE7_9BACL|nr:MULTISPECIES: acyl-CoA thioesterase [Planococcus]ALS79018.1 thioesterase [Planococcus kocurii]AQU79026.1 thioesterase [Planococcus faecalis]KAA0957883.1 acyl-CoA thioesterase [Planococcus sp. ANT_H30]
MTANYIGNLEEWKQEFIFSAPVQVRFSETDMFGHVNNTVPIAYFEFARIEFMKEMGLMQRWLKTGNELFPVVADMQVDFVQQVFFDEKLKVYVKIARIGTSSVDVHYWTVNEKEETCFTGRGAIVQISKHTGKGHPWSDQEIEMLQSKQLISAKK